MSHRLTFVILHLFLTGLIAAQSSPKILFADQKEVIFLLPGGKGHKTVSLDSLPTADQEAIAIWRESPQGKKAKRPTLKKNTPKTNPPQKNKTKPKPDAEKPLVYDPKASYRERQRALSSFFKTIPNNFTDPWPSLVKSPEDTTVEIVDQDEETQRYTYHSDHYEFICDVPLKKHLVQRFAVLFEGTRELCRVLPISTKKAHLSGDTFRHRILLFETRESYFKNGGPPGSAGVFMSGSRGNIVMVPLTSLGVKKLGSSYTVDYGESNKTLPHELAHQLTDSFYYAPGARGWFSEGLAEYVAVTPYRSGKFLVSKTLRAAKEYATEYGRDGNGGRALGEKIKAPNLKSYMLQDYSSFTANGNFNYGLGLLITTYFFELENKGDRVAITAFLEALREGKKGEEALEALLQGRSYNELANDISKGWKSRGIKIEFAESSS